MVPTRRARRATRRTRRSPAAQGAASTMQQPQLQWPSDRIRLFLFPPEALLARYLAVTMAALTWYVVNRGFVKSIDRDCGGPCELREGYDAMRSAEYVEVVCSNCPNLDTIAVKLWGMTAQSFTAAAWDLVRVEYDERSQAYLIASGVKPEFVKQPYMKNIQKTLIANYLKYQFGRGFALEPVQSESDRSLEPQAGFVDLRLNEIRAYLYALEQLRRDIRRTSSEASRSVLILLADLGDKSTGLSEAISTLYNVEVGKTAGRAKAGSRRSGSTEKLVSVSLRLRSLSVAMNIARYGGEFLEWLHYLFIVEVLYGVVQESIKVLARWPHIAIIHYRAEKGREDTRFIDYVVIGGEDLLLAYYSVAGAAGELGVPTWRLLGFLDALPQCILDAGRRGLLRDTEVSGLVSRLLPVYDSVLQGFVDRDALYQVIRPLFAKSVSSIPSCSFAASMLSGW